jgi:hypothetical protein
MESVNLREHVTNDIAYGKDDNAGRKNKTEDAHQLYRRDVGGYEAGNEDSNDDYEPLRIYFSRRRGSTF